MIEGVESVFIRKEKMHVCLFLYMRFQGCVREWADEILAFCEMLSDAVQCQSSLAAPHYEGCFVLPFFKFNCIWLYLQLYNRLCHINDKSNKSVNDIS